MGLAAKMAAAGGTYAAVNAGVDQYQQHQQAGAAPAQVPGQYGVPPPGQYGMQAPPPGQYGMQAPPQQQPQQQQDGSAFAGIISQKLHAIVAANGLQPLYPAAALEHVIRGAQGVDFRALAAKYNMPGALYMCHYLYTISPWATSSMSHGTRRWAPAHCMKARLGCARHTQSTMYVDGRQYFVQWSWRWTSWCWPCTTSP